MRLFAGISSNLIIRLGVQLDCLHESVSNVQGGALEHTANITTGRYGIMSQGMLKQRVELVNSIGYPVRSIYTRVRTFI